MIEPNDSDFNPVSHDLHALLLAILEAFISSKIHQSMLSVINAALD